MTKTERDIGRIEAHVERREEPRPPERPELPYNTLVFSLVAIGWAGRAAARAATQK